MNLLFSRFSFWTQYCQTNNRGKGICPVYKHIQSNWTYPYPNINHALPQISGSFTINNITRDCVAYVGSHNYSSPVSDQNTINLIDNDVYNNENLQYFETPMKHNHSATKLCNTTKTTSKIHIKYHTRPFQKHSSTISTPLQIPPYGKEYIC